jgi:hypothetical protein
MEYQNDPAENGLIQAGIIVPFIPNKLLPDTFIQVRGFLMHSKKDNYNFVAEVMGGGKLTFGLWDYYEKNGASAVTGNAFFEIAFGRIFNYKYSPLSFLTVHRYHDDVSALDKEEMEKSRNYLELSIPFINISSYYKAFRDGKEQYYGLSYGMLLSKGTLEYFDLTLEKTPQDDYTIRANALGIVDWFSFRFAYNTQRSLVYSVLALDHTFVLRGDMKGEEAYFSKKYAFTIGFKLFGGYYSPANDPDIDLNLVNYDKSPFTAGFDFSIQVPFMIYLDSVLMLGAGVLTVMSVATDSVMFLASLLYGGGDSVWEFYLTQMSVALMGALASDIGRQYDRDLWKDNIVWSQFHMGVHYRDRTSILHNPTQLQQKYGSWTDELFYYAKLDIFF